MTPRITINEEVRRSLQEHPSKGVPVEDDSTHVQYVLVPIDTYQKVESLIYDASEPDPDEFLPLAHEALSDDWDAPGMEAYDDYDSHKPAS